MLSPIAFLTPPLYEVERGRGVRFLSSPISNLVTDTRQWLGSEVSDYTTPSSPLETSTSPCSEPAQVVDFLQDPPPLKPYHEAIE
jgi:hypothetical protein